MNTSTQHCCPSEISGLQALVCLRASSSRYPAFALEPWRRPAPLRAFSRSLPRALNLDLFGGDQTADDARRVELLFALAVSGGPEAARDQDVSPGVPDQHHQAAVL